MPENIEALKHMRSSGVALVVSAPSGAGKTTLIERLRKEFPNIAYSISCTTRSPRKNEQDGKDYYFLSEEAFISRRHNKDFAEWAHVHNYLYGTPIGPIVSALGAGKDMLFDIDVKGASQLKLTIPYGKYAFLLPPSMNELEKRLRIRGTDNKNTIKKRVSGAAQEIQQAGWFDAWIVNEHIDKAYEELRAFYISSKLSPICQPNLIRSIIEND